MRLNSLAAPTILPGLGDVVHDSNRLFRALLEAMAHPGEILTCPLTPPEFENVHAAALAILLTLADAETPVWLQVTPAPSLAEYLRFHCGCSIVDNPSDAQFGLIADTSHSREAFACPIGDDEYPDKSATVIVQVRHFNAGPVRTLKGPGINGSRQFSASLDEKFWAGWQANTSLYPRGIDVILTCGAQFAALPRSAKLEI